MDLKDIRKEIDAVDDQIAALINKRMEIVKKVAEYKKQAGVNAAGIRDIKRETEILARICTGENKETLRQIFTAIFETSCACQSDFLS